VLLLLGHAKIESTVRYLGIEVDDALAISEQIDVRAEGWPAPVARDPPRRPAGQGAATASLDALPA